MSTLIPASILHELEQPFDLSKQQLSFYQQNGYIKLRQVLSESAVQFFNEAISRVVSNMRKTDVPLNERNTYGKAFLQLFNLWTEDSTVKTLVFSKRLARLAAQLMGASGARLYHDQALFKEPGGGITPWHADQHYWPLNTDKTITAWMPLQATPLEMGPLEFSPGSQRILAGRELSIGDESEKLIGEKLKINDFPHVVEGFECGEISFHSGWVFHRAGANQSREMRKVMTVIYMDKETTLMEPKNSGQLNDWKTWCPGAEVGQIINTPLNPVLY
ncbi:MAG: phytanoyl-CoA dioxygenase family protein [Saprospiraceae bacterium]|nr:phytanoyl-CoA dioxygenase family protein [Saprospiraceae bacterium]HRD81603.1 phytanoyl-CoA dioxygenase family protein [Saprospiraceae bacterium]HRJ16078.1 phytanoyl-CoA dioxygenase family protein [Saprospiraceae bacterium]HRK80366.1 phytanoyl-CoA dioxygenase family protein [Saprospiraceae bacterium]